MTHTVDTVGKMATLTMAGVGLSFADVESILRIASILVTMSLSVMVYVNDRKRRKERDETKVD